MKARSKLLGKSLGIGMMVVVLAATVVVTTHIGSTDIRGKAASNSCGQVCVPVTHLVAGKRVTTTSCVPVPCKKTCPVIKLNTAGTCPDGKTIKYVMQNADCSRSTTTCPSSGPNTTPIRLTPTPIPIQAFNKPLVTSISSQNWKPGNIVVISGNYFIQPNTSVSNYKVYYSTSSSSSLYLVASVLPNQNNTDWEQPAIRFTVPILPASIGRLVIMWGAPVANLAVPYQITINPNPTPTPYVLTPTPTPKVCTPVSFSETKTAIGVDVTVAGSWWMSVKADPMWQSYESNFSILGVKLHFNVPTGTIYVYLDSYAGAPLCTMYVFGK